MQFHIARPAKSPADKAGKHFLPALDFPKHGIRKHSLAAPADYRKLHQALRMLDAEVAQKQCIEQREDSGVCPNRQREREHRQRGKTGIFRQYPDAEPNVLPQLLKPNEAPHVPRIFPDPLHVAKLAQSRIVRFLGGRPRAMLSCVSRSMKSRISWSRSSIICLRRPNNQSQRLMTCLHYSCLSETVGSTLAARQAGRPVATAAASSSTPSAPAYVRRSAKCTPDI